MKILKKGQISLFVIIAIVIISVILLIILIKPDFFRKDIPEQEVVKIKTYISDCLNLKAKQGVLFIAKQGGFYDLNKTESINFFEQKTAFYWKNETKQSEIPEASIVKKELVLWLKDNIKNCFYFKGYSFSFDEKECNIEFINDDNFISEAEGNATKEINFNCPIKISKGFASIRLENFSVSFDAPIMKILNVSEKIITEYVKTEQFCVTCYEDIASENNISITVIPITADFFDIEHIWFIITDKTKIDDKNLSWRFVVSF